MLTGKTRGQEIIRVVVVVVVVVVVISVVEREVKELSEMLLCLLFSLSTEVNKVFFNFYMNSLIS